MDPIHWVVLVVALVVVGLMAGWVYMNWAPRHECRILNLYFANDQEELDYFRLHIAPRLTAHRNVKWYLGKFSDGVVSTLDTNSTWVSTRSPELWFREVLTTNNFDALVYSGHSGGPYLGNEDDPMISMSIFARILRSIKHELAFIWFDSCNMGFLQSLVLLDGVAKYVVGAPNYYDWQSVLQTREIYHLCHGSSSELESVIRSQASKYDGDAETLVELCIYRPDRLSTLWLLYKQYHHQLVHNDSAQIEGDYYDVQDILDASAGVVGTGVLKQMQSALDGGLVSRRRCDKCALDVRDSVLAVQKNRDLDGSLLESRDGD